MPQSKAPPARKFFLPTAQAPCRTFQDLMDEEAPGTPFDAAADEGLSGEVMVQASMAGAADLRPDLGVPILSSPRLGLRPGLGRGEKSQSVIVVICKLARFLIVNDSLRFCV